MDDQEGHIGLRQLRNTKDPRTVDESEVLLEKRPTVNGMDTNTTWIDSLKTCISPSLRTCVKYGFNVKNKLETYTQKDMNAMYPNPHGMNGIHELTFFMVCCKYQTGEFIKNLMDTYTSEELKLNYRTLYAGQTAFMLCCIYQPGDVVKEMMKRYTKEELCIHAKGLSAYTAFMCSCIHQTSDVVREMMNTYSAEELNMTAVSQSMHRHNDTFYCAGCNAFMLCCRHQSSELLIEMMDRYSVNELGIDRPNSVGRTIFMCCCMCRGTTDVLEELMKRYTSKELMLSHKTIDGATSFMHCCAYQPDSVIEQMLDTYSNTELDIAQLERNNYSALYHYLVTRPDVLPSYGTSATLRARIRDRMDQPY